MWLVKGRGKSREEEREDRETHLHTLRDLFTPSVRLTLSLCVCDCVLSPGIMFMSHAITLPRFLLISSRSLPFRHWLLQQQQRRQNTASPAGEAASRSVEEARDTKEMTCSHETQRKGVREREMLDCASGSHGTQLPCVRVSACMIMSHRRILSFSLSLSLRPLTSTQPVGRGDTQGGEIEEDARQQPRAAAACERAQASE